MNFTQHKHNGVVYMTAPNIDTTHAFGARFGGVSSGIFATLNLGLNLDDKQENVKENYRRFCDAIGIETDDIVFSNQVHGTTIRTVSKSDRGGLFTPGKPQADGLITNEPGVALMVFTADCVPILLHDPVKGAIGAVHAGWRGTVAGIANVAVQAMIEQFGCNPHDIKAAIGPCIGVCCYEVGDDVVSALKKALGENISGSELNKCIVVITEDSTQNAQINTRYKADLKECNRLILEAAGVKDILISDECTHCSNDKYWSHRFTKGQRGSQVAIITMLT